jgi:hypothetical protein
MVIIKYTTHSSVAAAVAGKRDARREFHLHR